MLWVALAHNAGPVQENVEVVKQTAAAIAQVQQECGMDSPVDEYVRELRFGLVEVVYEWARGMPFKQITGVQRARRAGKRRTKGKGGATRVGTGGRGR
jgi:superfamily II RNA helicase